ncbi:MAG TPA: nuclear transport factor 2 family protein [Acidimicrobiales bacterium]|nr:nuclear transport factor 2 family protein [Acidimicrobiales bacterium]
MDIEDVDAICRLKHRYFRLLDTKKFRDLGELFVDDATTAYDSGNLSQRGRAEIVAFLERSLGNAGIVTMHHGHHPEIGLTADGTAKGVWYLEDRVIIREADLVIAGTAFYTDEYVKNDGNWLIRHTGYDRIFEEHRRHSTGELRSFVSRFDT